MYQAVPSHNAVVDRELRASWVWEAGSRINGGVAVVEDQIFVDDFAHELVALNLRSGKPIWKSTSVNVLMSTPVVEGGLVIVGSGHNGRLAGQNEDSPYSYDPRGKTSAVWGRLEGDEVTAFDASTGQKRWSFQTDGEDMPSPGFVDGALIFANGDLHAYAVNGGSGKLIWQQSIDGVATMASTTVVRHRAYISFCNDAPYRCWTNAIDPLVGTILWVSPYGNSDSSPSVAGRTVFVSGVNLENSNSTRGSGYVAALDLETGRKKWIYAEKSGGPFTQVGSSERAIAGTFVSGTYYQAFPTSDTFVAIDEKTGRARWTFHSAAPIKMSCVGYRGIVYVGDTAGLLYVLSAHDGRLLRTKSFPTGFSTSPPVIVGQTLLIAREETLMAIPLRELIPRDGKEAGKSTS